MMASHHFMLIFLFTWNPSILSFSVRDTPNQTILGSNGSNVSPTQQSIMDDVVAVWQQFRYQF